MEVVKCYVPLLVSTVTTPEGTRLLRVTVVSSQWRPTPTSNRLVNFDYRCDISLGLISVCQVFIEKYLEKVIESVFHLRVFGFRSCRCV